jgi:hypothetical protein
MKVNDMYELIGLDRYPINDLSSPAGQQLITQIRSSLEKTGSCSLPDFICAEAISAMAEQAGSLAPLAYRGPAEVTPYFFNYKLGDDIEVADDHPLNRKGRRNLSQVATDLIPEAHLLSRLYYSAVVSDFLAQVLEQSVYRNQDKYQSLNISMMEAGGCQQWHFDSGPMVTTLLLQEPEAGGHFEYVPDLRSDDDENFNDVQRVLDGERHRVKRIELKAGTLSLFRGHYSMHRVTEVSGARTRIQAILGFSTEPDLQGSLDSSILHYGPRVAELEGLA